MRKVIVSLIILATGCVKISAQVGINTGNPQAQFHVDGAKDNADTGAPSATQQANDVAITSSGSVGIGTINPTQKLEIQTGGVAGSPVTGFKLADGNQFDQYVLTSDATGIGTWKRATLTTIMGTQPNNDGIGDYTFKTSPVTAWQSTHQYITLPPGKWRVDVVELLRYDGSTVQLATSDYMWVRFTFGDSDTATAPTADFIGAAKYVSGNILDPTIAGTNKYGLAQGSVLIDNTETTAKSYYLLTGNSTSSVTDVNKKLLRLGGSFWAENIITAFPITQ
ncbi:hypothetical protein GCM10022217_11250 [Chryseobacterium ginsenosidimutans]|uniref:hypothetical protein n=1 Tax=Chryseobacterium ginsenosidimutans TaxID=687846 RepID=UPI0031CE827C